MSYEKTDDMQWCKKINIPHCYHLIEVRGEEDAFRIASAIIDISDYTKKEIQETLAMYGYDSIDTVNEIYGDDAEQIIAECIFECISCYELSMRGPVFDTEDEATEYIETNLLKAS